MSESHASDTPGTPHSIAPHVNYKKIYIALLVLLGISIAGPHFGIRWLTLVTAFGIAIVKATMVVQNFMHLKWEKTIMKWVLLTSVVLVALFWAAVRPDVSAHEGRNWENYAAKAATARGIPAPKEEGAIEGMEPERGITPRPAVARDTTQGAAATAAFDARGTFTTVCATCHGPAGEANGPMAASLNPRPANFSSAAFWAGKTDAELLKAIRQGGAAVGRSAMMPAWGGMFTNEQSVAMLTYVKTLRR